MKKLLTLLVLAVLLAGNMYAQFTSYGFLPSNGTYTEITGGILVGTESSDDQSFANDATPTVASTEGTGFPIGFNFVLNGITFDRLGINNNGWISLGQSALTPSVNIPGTTAPLNYSTAVTPAALRNRIAGFGYDIQARVGASLRVETIGTTPSRICVIQFKNYKRYGGSYTGDNFNFQIRLLETSNEVQIVYGDMTATVTDVATIQIGLGGNTDTEFYNRTSTTGWNTSLAGTNNSATMTYSSAIVPASGLTYTFATMTPLAAIYTSPANGAINLPTNVSLNWTANANAGATPTGYKVFMGTDNPPTNIANGTDIGNVLTYTAPVALGLNTQYNWQIVPYNAMGDATANPINNFKPGITDSNLTASLQSTAFFNNVPFNANCIINGTILSGSTGRNPHLNFNHSDKQTTAETAILSVVP